MRFLQALSETVLDPTRIPQLEEFKEEYTENIIEWYCKNTPGANDRDRSTWDLALAAFTPEIFQSLVERINKVDINNLYRGIVVPKRWLREFTPGTELGVYWSWSKDIAQSFSGGEGMDNYDDRFQPDEDEDDYWESTTHYSVLFHGAVTPDSIDVGGTIGTMIDMHEDEIKLIENAPVKLHSLSYIAYRVPKPMKTKKLGGMYQA